MNLPDPVTNEIGDASQIKIWFRFVPREGWLPFDTEGLWATRVGADTARICNVPLLARGVAEGDVVRYQLNSDGLRWAVGRVEASGNCTVRVLPVSSGPLGRSAARVHEQFVPFGMGSEVYSAELPLVALTVPAGADLAEVKKLLILGQDEGWWHFEASCVTPEWHQA
ncbi:DUF4265 domain-containing protein [Rhizocola hellebori]|uniref:DUF4265 domain-containing protein n=1 Tax=Rhizocola hellebori TaxID=1392758 RepID=UPI001EF183C7|nr:DUF4265 domain-containing protein [Rhizocola hellebori]